MDRARTMAEFDYVTALAACARQDRNALRELYDVEAGRLISVAQRIVRRREIAEEVVQETFVQIWRFAHTFDADTGSARAWIYTIVRNKALNVIRDGRREDLVGQDRLDATRDAGQETLDAFDRLATDSLLRRCLEAIDDEKRDSILLSYVAGYSHGEIAGLMGVPVGTAKSWVRRGLLALKECMT